jgi:hypothetical protein
MGGWNGTGKDNKGDMSLVEMASSNPKVYNRIRFSKGIQRWARKSFYSPHIENLKTLGLMPQN